MIFMTFASAIRVQTDQTSGGPGFLQFEGLANMIDEGLPFRWEPRLAA